MSDRRVSPEPIAYLVAERRNGKWLIGDDWNFRSESLDEAKRELAQWRVHGVDAGVFAVVPVDEAVKP